MLHLSLWPLKVLLDFVVLDALAKHLTTLLDSIGARPQVFQNRRLGLLLDLLSKVIHREFVVELVLWFGRDLVVDDLSTLNVWKETMELDHLLLRVWVDNRGLLGHFGGATLVRAELHLLDPLHGLGFRFGQHPSLLESLSYTQARLDIP